MMPPERPITCVPCKSRQPLREAEESVTGKIRHRILRCTNCGKARGVKAS